MKTPWTDPSLRELVALAALAALGCGLALAQGHLLFLAIFAAASVVTFIEAVRRSRWESFGSPSAASRALCHLPLPIEPHRAWRAWALLLFRQSPKLATDVDAGSITMGDAACRSATRVMTIAIGHIPGVSPAYPWMSDRTCDLISATRYRCPY